MAYQMTGDPKYALIAWNIIRPYIESNTLPWNSRNETKDHFITYVWMYDWLYPGLSAPQRDAFIKWLNWVGDLVLGKVKNVTWSTRLGNANITLVTTSASPSSIWRPPRRIPAREPSSRLLPDDNYGVKPVGGLTPTGANLDTMRNAIAKFAKAAQGGVWFEGAEYTLTTLP